MMFTGQRPINIGRLAGDVTSTFAAMTIRLAKSLACVGKTLRVFTNDPERLGILAERQCALLQLVPITSDSRFPSDIRFYAAHHKLGLFDLFAHESWPNCLLDVDMILAADALAVRDRLENPLPLEAWAYDISANQFAGWGRDHIQTDLMRLGVSCRFPRWYGGEFILGSPRFFAHLSAECERLIPTYLDMHNSLHHVSDEPILSVAINNLAGEFEIGDAGAAQLVIRYWSSPTLHAQPDTKALSQCAFWHLPDMKWALRRGVLSRTPGRLLSSLRFRKLVMTLRHAR